jgi:hypothetical protein
MNLKKKDFKEFLIIGVNKKLMDLSNTFVLSNTKGVNYSSRKKRVGKQISVLKAPVKI